MHAGERLIGPFETRGAPFQEMVDDADGVAIDGELALEPLVRREVVR